MRRLLIVVMFALAPALFAQHDTATSAPTHDTTGATAAHGSEHAASKEAHGEPAHESTHFAGLPRWVWKLANMLLFLGGLVYLVRGPVGKAFAERSAAIRRAADEAKERRVKSDQMASDIQARLTQIEQEVRSIHERAAAEGERQKRELIAAAEAEAQKILTAARTEVDNRLKHARTELTAYAGELAAGRAEQILREKITEQDQSKLFQESLREVGEVRA
jgi:F-type H+-transporting ATPase subunit b